MEDNNKRLTIQFGSDGLWSVYKNFEELNIEEEGTLKECVASLCEELEMNEEDFYFL